MKMRYDYFSLAKFVNNLSREVVFYNEFKGIRWRTEIWHKTENGWEKVFPRDVKLIIASRLPEVLCTSWNINETYKLLRIMSNTHSKDFLKKEMR